jgi:ADP-ribose pyrophosphatase YjhB (NUDIX family)
MKSNETLEQTLLREVREETGFEIEIRGLVGVYSGPERDCRFASVSVVYAAAIVDGVQQDSREEAVRWLDLRILPPCMAFDSHAAISDYVAKGASGSTGARLAT